MILASILPWLKSANLWLAAGILVLCVTIFTAGERHERRKAEAEIAKLNVPLAEMRGKDEAEVAAERDAASRADAIVAGAVTQTCFATAETARLLASVK